MALKIHPYNQKGGFKMQKNSKEGLILVRIKPTRIIAEKDIAAWE